MSTKTGAQQTILGHCGEILGELHTLTYTLEDKESAVQEEMLEKLKQVHQAVSKTTPIKYVKTQSLKPTYKRRMTYKRKSTRFTGRKGKK